MPNLSYETALIVGAGSGLSTSLARLFSREGLRVALAARNSEKLGALCAETGKEYNSKKVGIPQHLKKTAASRQGFMRSPLRAFCVQTLHHNCFEATRSFTANVPRFALICDAMALPPGPCGE